MKKKFSSEAVNAGRRAAGRNAGQERSDTLKLFCAALMTTTALVAIVPQQARATDKIVDGVQEAVNSPQTFDNVVVGDTLPNSELDIGLAGDLTVNSDLTVGNQNGSKGTLVISGGGEANSVFIGKDSGSEGTATVSGSGANFESDTRVVVGRAGTGSLIVTNGGSVDTGSTFSVGTASGGSGTVTISGAGSKVVNSFATHIGNIGTGTLTISNRGELDGSDVVFFGFGTGSQGTGTVTGSGSKLSGLNIAVGRQGTGTLTVSDGGVVEATTELTIAGFTGSTGTLNIGAAVGETAVAAGNVQDAGGLPASIAFGLGTGTLVFNHTDAALLFDAAISGSGDIDVFSGTTILSGTNDIGTGTITVEGGTLQIAGTTTSTDVYVGKDTGSNGTLTISGSGSQLTANDDIVVGVRETGALSVADGGSATAGGDLIIGQYLDGTGTVTLSGTGSTLTTGDDAFVGLSGTGTLTISEGATATIADKVLLGGNADANGTVNVTGNGSELTSGNSFTVGFNGEGALSVANGGSVAATGDLFIGLYSQGSGTITLSGSGTSLTAGGDVFMGAAGSGALTVSNGATATFADEVLLGGNGGSTGTVSVTDSGSKLTSGNDFTVGLNGTGTLSISNGGVVEGGGHVYVGTSTGSSGTVTISGSGSTLNVGSYLYLAYDAGSSGVLTVSGSGAQVTSDALLLGQGGATLNILDGGDIAITDLAVIGAGSASATISGAGSSLTVGSSGELRVADAGSATLDILAGGTASGGDVRLGRLAGANATVTVSGAGSKLTAGDDTGFKKIIVGEAGTGTLTLSNGGTAQAGGRIFLGYEAGSTGTVTVSGTGSRLVSVNSAIVVGEDGNGRLDISNGGEANVKNDIYLGRFAGSEGTVTISGSGSKLSAGVSFYVGRVGTGTLEISNGGEAFAFRDIHIGAVAGSEGSVTVSGAGSKLTAGDELGIVTIKVGESGTGTLTVSDGGTARARDGFTIAQNAGSTGSLNIGAASGASAAAAGNITDSNGDATTITFGTGTGTLVFNHTDTDLDFNSAVSGNGAILHEAGLTSLTGDFSAFSGTGEVTGGTLSVDTDFGGTVDVRSSGTLTGSGAVGNIDFAAGSFYQATIGGNGFLTSTGTATIDAGSQVKVAFDDLSGVAIWQPIEILSAGTVTGEFGSTNQDSFLFLNFDLSYDPTSVFLTLERNDAAFDDLAETPNQAAVARAVNALPNGNDLYDAFAIQTDAGAIPGILDQLSGEAHASAQGIVFQDSATFRNIISGRINGAFAASGQGTSSQIATNGPGDGLPEFLTSGEIWGEAYGSFGRTFGNANAAGVTRNSGGLVAGLERDGFYGFNAGLLAGYGRTDARVKGRSSDATIDSYTIGAYAGRAYGPLEAQAGTTFSWNEVSSSRSVAFPGFTDTLTADYTSLSFQAFGEVGYGFETPVARLQPFAGLAVTHVTTDGFTEKGGAAALRVEGSSQTLGVSTLGMRARRQVGALDNGAIVTFTGALAWRHSFGDLTPSVTSAFVGGSQSFTVAGTPIDRDTALVEAGVTLSVTEQLDLSAAYRGEFGQAATDNSFNARFGYRF